MGFKTDIRRQNVSEWKSTLLETMVMMKQETVLHTEYLG